ncbi:WD-40 repeat-containing protein [Panus rudis PR-1116 ss-1]|nr:WD-40 repeat-containing protein [Panus rudis PR-1116 ss-1]
MVFEFDTGFPADTVEFCPHPEATDIFVCGTYKLDENAPTDTSGSQRRRGKCLVLQVDRDADSFKTVHEVSLPAVPDVKWCHRTAEATPAIAVADSEGNVTIFEYHVQEKKVQEMQAIRLAPPSVLSLSLDWSNRRTPTSGYGSLIVSLSNGALSLLRPDSTGLVVESTWHAHDFEPWIAAWNYWDNNVIYSGGDDLRMKGWDARAGFENPIFTNKKCDAGVTSIQSHPNLEHLLAVGSYDNTVRLFDVRKPLVPLCQTDVGGGAWRVKWHPSEKRKGDLLVACMHDGCKVVRFPVGSEKLDGDGEVVRRFDQHQSMAYGTDWSFAQEDGKEETLVASCSFYDHVLYTWRA